MKSSERKANYDLLRLVAMFMVVTMHYLNYSGALLVLGEDAGSKQLIGTAVEALCIFAVNVYVLISGYFLVDAGFRLKRLLLLILQVLFYSLLIPVVMLPVTGNAGFDLYRLFGYLLPIQTEHYWFATAYVLLTLFLPVLNAAVRKLTKRQLQITIGCVLFVFSIVKSISPIALVIDRYGYDFGWFLCLYLVAAYIRLYGIAFFKTAKRAWLTYAACAAAIYGLVVALYAAGRTTGAFAYYATVPFHYNYILTLIGAVALFYAFGHIKVKEGAAKRVICRLAPYAFGVYLFHEHIDIRSIWAVFLNDFIGLEPLLGTAGFLIQWIIAALVIFAAGILIDMVRSLIFGFAGRLLKGGRIESWIVRVDQYFIQTEGNRQ